MIKNREASRLRFDQRAVIPLVVMIAMVLLMAAGILLAMAGIPFTFHIGPSP